MGLARRGRGAMRRRCSFIADESRRRDRPQPPSAQRVAAKRPRLRCRSSVTMNEHCFLVAPRIRGRCARNNGAARSEEHTSELQSLTNLVCRLLLEKKKKTEMTDLSL